MQIWLLWRHFSKQAENTYPFLGILERGPHFLPTCSPSPFEILQYEQALTVKKGRKLWKEGSLKISGNFQSCWRNEIHCPIELFIWWFKRKQSDAEYVIPWLYREECQWCGFSPSLTVLPVSKEILNSILKYWVKCWTKGYESLLVTLSFLS